MKPAPTPNANGAGYHQINELFDVGFLKLI
jgi:hypothetical protein